MQGYNVRGARLLTDDEILRAEQSLESSLAPPPPAPPAAPPAAVAPPDDEISQSPAELPGSVPAPPPARSAAKNPSLEDLLAVFERKKQAQQKAADVRGLTTFGRIGQQLVEQTTGAKGGDVYDHIDAQAEAGVGDADADLAALRLQKSFADAQAKDDPNSPANRAAQVALQTANPVLAKKLGDQLWTLTEAQLDGLVKSGQKDRELELRGETAEALATWRRLQDENTDQARHQKDTHFQQEYPLKKAAAVSQRISALKTPMGIGVGLGGPGGQASPVDARKTTTRVDALGKATKPFADYHSALTAVEAAAPGLIKGKVPEDFPLTPGQRILARDPTGVLTRAADPRALKIEQSVNELVDLLGRDRSGAVLNEQETAAYIKKFRNALGSGPEAMAIALNDFRRMIAQRMKQAQLSYEKKEQTADASPFDIWAQDLGGLTYRDPLLFDESDAPHIRTAPSPQVPRPTPAKTPAKAPAANDNLPDPDLMAPVKVRMLKGPRAGKTGVLPKGVAEQAIAAGAAELVGG